MQQKWKKKAAWKNSWNVEGEKNKPKRDFNTSFASEISETNKIFKSFSSPTKFTGL